MDESQATPESPEGGNNGKRPRKRLRDRIKKPRFRVTYIWIVGLIVIGLSLLTDPDTGFIRELPFGAGTVATLIVMSRAILYCGLLHFSRKGLMDYFDMEEAWDRAKQEPMAAAMFAVGAGMYTIAMGLVVIAAHMK